MTTYRQTADLTAYPDLIVVYLGMRVNVLTGIKTLIGFGPKIDGSVAAQPDGLLLHENLIYSMFPPHVGMRQYWRDFESLERWTRTEPHRPWWKQFCRIRAEPAFGTSYIRCEAALNRSISMFKNRSASSDSRNRSRQKAAFSPPVTVCVAAE